MALPSAVTVGSLAVILAAGAGLVVMAADSDEQTTPTSSASSEPTVSPEPPAADPKVDKPRHRTPVDVVPKILIDVYNNSGVSGLAADRATFLRGAGWNVAATDNWYGDIPDNTVYFPARLRDEARQLAKALAIDRLRPAVSPMQFDRLTVIFTIAS